MTGPMVGGDLWRAVTSREGGTCGCAGECGKRHHDTAGRCDRHDELVVAPRDLSTPLAVAVTLDSADLTAWCDRCHKPAQAAAVKATRAAREARYETDALF